MSDVDAAERVLHVVIADPRGARLDKALSATPEVHEAALSRERIKALLREGAITFEGATLSDGAAPAHAGAYAITLPDVVEGDAQPQDIPLTILFEDAHLIVIDKAAGMAAHPAPGTPDGTLVNALLHHCAGSLSGVGGVARPGIVHRLDKDTSGVMVAAKTDAAHHGLADLFARHDIQRSYIALVRGAPDPFKGTITTRIGRSHHDRKKMAVLRADGREAITHYRVEQPFGSAEKPLASRTRCTLETGRTHQIRVHMAHKGSPVLGDPIYGSGVPAKAVRDAITEAGLARQALHAAVLGFVHPISGEALRFQTAPPLDMQRLEALLGEL